jgi:hypothetical protein
MTKKKNNVVRFPKASSRPASPASSPEKRLASILNEIIAKDGMVAAYHKVAGFAEALRRDIEKKRKLDAS